MEEQNPMSLLEGFEHIVQENVPLAPLTRLRLGGMAHYLAQPTSKEELVGLVQRFHQAEVPIKILGNGANVLVPDEGFGGLVVQLSAPAFCEISVDGNRMVAGGGVQLSHFVSVAVREGFAGPEQLVGIPGTVGGSLHLNTSVHGGNIGTWTRQATVITAKGELLVREVNDLNFSYRKSSLTELAIVGAAFEFEKETPEVLGKRMQKLWIVRKARQPMLDEACAYVFKDHGGTGASSLLEEAGIQGIRVGGVEISDRDPNFFIAHEDATAADFLKLVELVKAQVHERLNVALELSVDVW